MSPQVLIPICIGVVVLVLIAARNAKPRALKINQLWIYPAIFFVIAALSLSQVVARHVQLTPMDEIIIPVALLIGVGLGYFRGRLTHIEVHPETGQLMSKVSPLGLAFIFAVFILRMSLRAFLPPSSQISEYGLGESFLLLAIGVIATARLEMWIRARSVMAKAGKAV